MNRSPIADCGCEEQGSIPGESGCGLTIREVTEVDIENILDIERQSFVTPWTKGMIKETLVSPISVNFALEEGGRLLGYIILYSVADEAHILNLAIHPARRREGHGLRLISHAIDYSRNRGVSNFFLEVRESNHSAQGLYRKLGFKAIGRRKRYYEETKEDALVMQLSLE